MKKKQSKRRNAQIQLRDLGMLIRRSRIPWFWVIVTFVFNLFYNRILFNLPLSTGKLLGGDLSQEALNETLLYYGAYSLCVIVQSLIQAFAYSVTTRRARNQLWCRMLQIREDYYDTVDSSVMLSAVTYDLGYAMPTLVNLIVAVVPDLIYVFRALKMIDSYDPILLLVVILFLPVKYIYMILVGRRVYTTEATVREKTGLLTGKLEERLANTLLIKSYNKEEKESDIGAETIEQLYKADVAVAKLGGISLSLEQGIELAQQFIIMVIAVLLLQNGKIDISQWIAFFLFSTNLSSKFGTLIEDWMNVKTITGSLERTTALYHAPVEDTKERGNALGSDGNYDIVFHDVSFAYGDNSECDGYVMEIPEEHLGKRDISLEFSEADNENSKGTQTSQVKALNKVSFEIKQGQKVAIVGSCGSGKSTALALMERFYEPSEGAITLGGRPINEYQLESYREHFAYVPQNHSVFTGTLKEALLYGNKKAQSDEEILRAAEETGFDQYLSLQEDGLSSMVRNGGDMMSGGQLQKLILTREKLRDSKIVLLDEPASALDAQSSQRMKELIQEGFEDKTVICVTHDLSFIDDMDQIIILDRGTLVDRGRYKELLERCEHFRGMVENQRCEHFRGMIETERGEHSSGLVESQKGEHSRRMIEKGRSTHSQGLTENPNGEVLV